MPEVAVDAWARIREALDGDVRVGPQLQGFMNLVEPKGIMAGVIYLEVPNDFTRSMLEQRGAHAADRGDRRAVRRLRDPHLRRHGEPGDRAGPYGSVASTTAPLTAVARTEPAEIPRTPPATFRARGGADDKRSRRASRA